MGIECQIIAAFVEGQPRELGSLPAQVLLQVMNEGTGGADRRVFAAQPKAIERGDLEMIFQGIKTRLRGEDPVLVKGHMRESGQERLPELFGF